MRAKFLAGVVGILVGAGSVSAQLIPSGPGFRLSAPGTGKHSAPSISAGFQGRKVVVWAHQESETCSAILGQRLEADARLLGFPFRASAAIDCVPGGSSTIEPRVAVAPNANLFSVTWKLDPLQFPAAITATLQRFDLFGGFLGTPIAAGGVLDEVGTLVNRALSFQQNGRSLVVWELPTSSLPERPPGLYGRVYNANGTPATDALLLRRENSGSAIWAGGALSVSWMEGNNPIRLNFQRFTPAGAPQGNPQQVATLTVPLHRIEMAANTAGETLIVWSVQAGTRWTVQGRIYRANGTPKTNAFRIDTDSSNSLVLTDPAAASDGRNFAVAWDNHGDPGSVFVRFVDANGAMPGAPVQVDPFNRSVQVAPAVAGGPAGSFTVVWEDHGGDGGSDIVGQHFIVPAAP